MPNQVIDVLQNKYLIRAEERVGSKWFELTHDRLIKPIKDSNKDWFDKKQKSEKKFRIKVLVPIIIISIISISLYFLYLQTNIQEQRQELLQSTDTLLSGGIALYNLERYNEAIAQFNRVLAVEPTNIDAIYYKGLSLYNLERYIEAIAYYDRILEIDPNNISATKEKEKIQQIQQNQSNIYNN